MELEQRIIRCRNNPYEINNIITQYKPFIVKTVQEHIGRSVNDGEEKFDIGLMAFEEAIRTYDETKGKFLIFTKSVIEKRLKDYYKDNKKNNIISDNSSSSENIFTKITNVKKEESIKKDRRTSIIERVAKNNVRKYIIIISAFLLILLVGINTWSYFSTYGYFSIDINPSIQLEYNKFDRILNANSLNSEGQKILDKLEQIKNIKVEDVTTDIVEIAYQMEYLEDDSENNLFLSFYVPNDKKNERLQLKVTKAINKYLITNNKDVELLLENVTNEEFVRARKDNISFGKLKLYDKAKKINSEITLEEIKEMDVRNIIEFIRGNEKKDKIEEEKQTIESTFEENSISIIKPTKPQYDTTKDVNQPSEIDAKNTDNEVENDIKLNDNILEKIENNFNNEQKNSNTKTEIKIPEIPKIDSNNKPNDKVNDKIENINKRIDEINDKMKIQ